MIQHYLRIGRRWLWLLLLAAAVSGAVGYVIAKQQAQTYSASARVIIGPGLESPNPNLDELRTAGMLMQTYAELITTKPFLENVIRTLDLQTTPEQLSRRINIHTDETTRILAIRVEADSATVAPAIANTIAARLVDLGPVGAEESQARIREQTRNQIAYLEQEIASLEDTLTQLEQDFAAATNQEERRLLGDQIALRRAQLADASQNVISLDQSLLESQTNRLRIIEPATTGILVESDLELSVALAAMAGLIFGAVVVFLFEYFGDVVQSEDELVDLTHMPLLGVIAKRKPLRGDGRDQLVAFRAPESRAAESYRLLASKLMLSRYKSTALMQRSSVDGQDVPTENSVRSLLISGTHASDTTASEIAANLAVVLAQTGHRVILVEANPYQPEIGQLMGLDNRSGPTSSSGSQTGEGQPTPVGWLPTLSVLVSGPLSTSSFDLLASTRMADLLHELEEQADLVLVAGSPLLLYADSMVLASRVDGVVVVAQQGVTRRATLLEIVKTLHEYGAVIQGLILDQNKSQGTASRSTQDDKRSASPGGVVDMQPAKRA